MKRNVKVTIDCAKETECIQPRSAKAYKRKKLAGHKLFLCDVDVMGEITQRVMSLRTLRIGKKLHAVMMDVITGSMYSTRTGRCASTDQLRIIKAIRDDFECKRLVLAMTATHSHGNVIYDYAEAA